MSDDPVVVTLDMLLDKEGRIPVRCKPRSTTRRRVASTTEDPAEGGSVYFIRHPDGFIKIGKAQGHPHNVKVRLKDLQGANPHELELLGSVACKEYSKLEAHLHGAFKLQRVRGEWFKLTDYDVRKTFEFFGLKVPEFAKDAEDPHAEPFDAEGVYPTQNYKHFRKYRPNRPRTVTKG